LNQLPSILLDIANTPQLGEDTLDEVLQDAFKDFPTDLRNSVLSGVKGIIGAEGKPDALFQAINDDLFGTAAKVGQAFQSTFDVFREFAPKIQEQADRISQAFGIYADAQLRANEIQGDILSRQESLRDSIATIRGSRVSIGSVTSARDSRIATIGGSDIAGL